LEPAGHLGVFQNKIIFNLTLCCDLSHNARLAPNH
jgi:hypothetical protein